MPTVTEGMRPFAIALGAITVLSALVGCGQKGPLVLPPAQPASGVKASAPNIPASAVHP